jgi:hypothetical protein
MESFLLHGAYIYVESIAIIPIKTLALGVKQRLHYTTINASEKIKDNLEPR